MPCARQPRTWALTASPERESISFCARDAPAASASSRCVAAHSASSDPKNSTSLRAVRAPTPAVRLSQIQTPSALVMGSTYLQYFSLLLR